MMPTYHKATYEAVADILSEAMCNDYNNDEGTIRDIEQEFVHLFRADNELFDAAKFRERVNKDIIFLRS